MINIRSDSRKVKPGDIFVALKGISSNGSQYIEDAIKNGASKLIVEEDGNYSIPYEVVDDSRKYLENYLVNNYNKYLDEMTLIGITGTNGKTTTAFLLYDALNKLGRKCAYMGTIGFYLEDKVYSLPNTSPDVTEVYDMIITAYDSGYRYMTLEISSHGLDMNRLEGINFDYAVFTNLTQDHLDFHKDMDDYFNAKKKLFEKLPNDGFAIINADDFTYDGLKKCTSASVYSYGVHNGDFKAENLSLEMEDTQFDIDGMHITSDLLSIANVYNLSAVYAVLKVLGYNKEDIASIVSSLPHIDGRMEKVYNGEFLALVDYAHSPDSVENALSFLSEIKKGRLIALVGCGGDRDKTKRPKMAKVACEKSDIAILTSDNPRTEDPEAILKDMQEGLNYDNYYVIVNRKEAIQKAISMAQPGDVIAVLGKGHEDYQIIGTTKYHFSDKEEILEAVKGE